MTRSEALLGGRRAPWIAFVVGVASAFSYQPVGLWPLMPIAFALLAMMASLAPTWKRAAFIGWIFGLGQFVLGLNWIATAFTYQAAMPAWLGWLAVFLLSLYLAVYPALGVLAGWFARKSPSGMVLALAGGWSISEWLRAKVFTGFSWNPVGVALVDTPWRETSATIGTYGLSALIVLVGGALWLLAKREWKLPAAVAGALMLLPLLPDPIVVHTDEQVTTFDLDEPVRQPVDAEPSSPTAASAAASDLPPPPPVPPRLPRDESFASPFRPIRIVQPNLPQEIKYAPGADAFAAARLVGLSTQPTEDGAPPRLLFWPEAALLDPLRDERTLGSGLALQVRETAADAIDPYTLLLTGGVGLLSKDGREVTSATNSVFAIDDEANIRARYDKAHLVPYGEYLPMRPVLSAIGLSRLVPGSMDFAEGPGPRTLTLPGGLKMGVQVCYEIIFSGQVIDRDDRPDFLFNPSNDAWFGAWGPPQHLAQARLRAAEEGIPIVRSTPTGISAVVAADGELLESIPLGQQGVIDTMLPLPAARVTPFAALGNVIPLVLSALMLLGGVALARRAR